ncbi:MAG: CAP domain-containing protein [Cyclobacteriaceae bacterium]|nr:CAP domain-containing protein [Cyclobacteriaceae bacterium]
MNYLSLAITLYFLFSCPIEPTSSVATPEEIAVLLERHNFWRKEVGVPPLEWSDELANSANKWAVSLKNDNCGFYHSKTEYGENLWSGTSGAFPVSEVVDSWADEQKDYNYEKNKCKTGKMCGHYTQVVWKNTQKVGCAKVNCKGMTTWVCQYDPPGNWVGKKPY